LTKRGAIDYFSYHPWKTYVPEAIHEMPWVNTVGDLWRTTVDIRPSWKSILSNAYGNNRWAVHQLPGHYNDADMLEVGNGDLTLAEQRSHFALWCVMKSPLLIGADARTLPRESLAILTNEGLIAINQDALGVQGTLRSTVAVAAAQQVRGTTAKVHAAVRMGHGGGGARRNASGLLSAAGSITGSITGSPFVAPCTFGAAVIAEQQWRIDPNGRLLSTLPNNECLLRSGDSSAVSTNTDCADQRSQWDFGRANNTLSQVRAHDNTSVLMNHCYCMYTDESLLYCMYTDESLLYCMYTD
jgi:hypothetical protein